MGTYVYGCVCVCVCVRVRVRELNVPARVPKGALLPKDAHNVSGVFAREGPWLWLWSPCCRPGVIDRLK
jgi:hypothetical protein